MRLCATLCLALLIAHQFQTFDDKDNVTENGGFKQKQPTQQGKAGSQEPRKFRVSFEFSMEQQDKNGDAAFEGNTVPGRTVHRRGSTLDILNDKPFTSPHSSRFTENARHRYTHDEWIEIKITSLRKDLIHLVITAKQSRTQLLEPGESHS